MNSDKANEQSISTKFPVVRLHSDLVINSNQQTSAQGSVFYVKQTKDIDLELVLKIYKDDHLKSYFREKAILNELANLGKKKDVFEFHVESLGQYKP